MKNCPNCGAPGQHYQCEYCGSALEERYNSSTSYKINYALDREAFRDLSGKIVRYSSGPIHCVRIYDPRTGMWHESFS